MSAEASREQRDRQVRDIESAYDAARQRQLKTEQGLSRAQADWRARFEQKHTAARPHQGRWT